MSGCTHDLDQVGFLIDPYAAAYVLLAYDKAHDDVSEEIAALIESGEFDELAKAGTLPDDYSDPDAALEVIDKIAVCASGFDGTVTTVFPKRAACPIEKTYDPDINDPVYIPAGRKPDLFKAAYPLPAVLLEEFQSVFASLNITFPDDFDWWARIAHIKGTEFF